MSWDGDAFDSVTDEELVQMGLGYLLDVPLVPAPKKLNAQMTYLLDTHTFIWFLRIPGSLPPRVQKLIEGPSTTLAVSLATPWEISIKASAGRLAW